MTLTFGSLFAGVGGFDLGFESAGYECRFQVEWDSHCQQTLAHHWPDVPRWGDVSTVNGANLPPVDVITYGFPCQDLSVAGKRAGLDGQRSHLFFEAVRIITEMREATNGRYPTWAVAENVAGLLNADGGSAMARVVDELAAAGAVVIEWATLDAQWFGVPQRRRRVFIASCFDPATGDRCPDPLFPVGKSSDRDTETGEPARETAAGVVGTGIADGGEHIPRTFPTLNTGDGTKWGSNQWVNEGKAIVQPTWWDGGQTADTLTTTSDVQRTPDRNRLQAVVVDVYNHTTSDDISHTLTGSRSDHVPHVIPAQVTFVKVVRSGARDQDGNLPPEVWREEHTNPTLNQFDTGDTRATTAVVFDPSRRDGARIQTDTSNTLTGHMGTGGNNTPMVADTVAFSHTQGIDCQPSTEHFPTLRGQGGGQAVAQPDLAVRRLTPLECERLMGWPDQHTLHRADSKTNADSTRYKMCGNGVASPVAAWIARHLANTLTP